jgi:hypothetical protein
MCAGVEFTGDGAEIAMPEPLTVGNSLMCQPGAKPSTSVRAAPMPSTRMNSSGSGSA